MQVRVRLKLVGSIGMTFVCKGSSDQEDVLAMVLDLERERGGKLAGLQS